MKDVRVRSVLVVEDDFTREIGLMGRLEKAGLMAESSGGEDPYKAVERLHPAALVLDIIDKNNVNEVSIVEILDHEDLASTEIFVYTPVIDVSLEVRMRKMGLSNYLIKDKRNPDALITQLLQFFEGWGDEAPVMLKELQKVKEEEEQKLKTGQTIAIDPMDDIITAIAEADGDINAEYTLNIKRSEDLMISGDFEEAIETLKGTEGSPKHRLKAALLNGISHRRLGKYREAIVILQTAAREAETDEEKMEFRYEIGVALDHFDKPKEAYRFLSAVYRQNKNYKDTAERLIRLHNQIYPNGTPTEGGG